MLSSSNWKVALRLHWAGRAVCFAGVPCICCGYWAFPLWTTTDPVCEGEEVHRILKLIVTWEAAWLRHCQKLAAQSVSEDPGPHASIQRHVRGYMLSPERGGAGVSSTARRSQWAKSQGWLQRQGKICLLAGLKRQEKTCWNTHEISTRQRGTFTVRKTCVLVSCMPHIDWMALVVCHKLTKPLAMRFKCNTWKAFIKVWPQ